MTQDWDAKAREIASDIDADWSWDCQQPSKEGYNEAVELISDALAAAYAAGRAEGIEGAVTALEYFHEVHRVVQPEKRSQFNVYDLDRYWRAAVRLATDDVRALLTTPPGQSEGGGGC